MSTQLLIARTNIDADFLAERIPPHCNKGETSPLNWQSGPGESLRFEFALPPQLLADAGRIIPCFSCTSEQDYGYQFSLEFETREGNSKETTSLSPIGDTGLEALVEDRAARPVRSEIDVFVLRRPLGAATLKLHVFSQDREDLKKSPSLVCASVSSVAEHPVEECRAAGTEVDIPVPPRSQMLQDPEIGPRICSPTSISMVLDHYGHSADPIEVAHRAYHLQHDLYGVWPSSIYAASRWGALGYLLAFPSWDAAQWLLDRHIPVIASIRYKKGELENAAFPATSGHLVVVRGYTTDAVVVNDPAADWAEEVYRHYAREEFTRIWLERSAVGYVIFPAGG